DPIANVWTTLPPMPAARQAPAVVAVGTKIYAIGGGTGTGWATRVDVFDTVTDLWGTTLLSPMPSQRAYMAAAAINVSGVDKIYVVGGTWQGSPSTHTVGSQTGIVE